jgi:biopolymer transport protein ExbB
MAQDTATNGKNAALKAEGGISSWFSPIVILISMIVAHIIFHTVFGSPSNFEGGDPNNFPVREGIGRWFGLIFKGGFVIPIAMGLLLMLIIFSIERVITLGRANGKGSLAQFVYSIQDKLNNDDLDGAIRLCDEQQGSLGNVVKETLREYKTQSANSHLDKETRAAAIQKRLEEATTLELPILEKHLTIVATLVSIATLVGLIGTVLGMIKAFSALGSGEGEGGDETAALSVGISEALINTALGITTSTIATVLYNYFTSRVDDMTFRIDEVGFSIVQTFNEKH